MHHGRKLASVPLVFITRCAKLVLESGVSDSTICIVTANLAVNLPDAVFLTSMLDARLTATAATW
jgi:hypothetical protein